MMRYFTPLIANAKNLQKAMLVSLFFKGFYNDISILILNVTKNKRSKGKHHIAHQTVLIVDLTALSIKSNMKLRLNDIFFMFSQYKPM